MLRSILVPLDGSVLAEQALPLALSLAGQAGAELRLLRVVAPPREPRAVRSMLPQANKYLVGLLEEAQNYLKNVEHRLLPSANSFSPAVNIRCDSYVDQAVAGISLFASVNQVDLIVMATHGRSGLRRWALGSVTDQLLQASAVPMLVVGPQSSSSLAPLPVFKRILVPLDGSTLGERVLGMAAEIGRLFQSELLLLHAEPPAAAGQEMPEVAALPAQRRQEGRAESSEYLRHQAAALVGRGVRVRLLMAECAVLEAIQSEASAQDADLIAMSTHGRTGLARLLFGSITDAVIRTMPRPVLVVTAGGRERGWGRGPQARDVNEARYRIEPDG
jgi:nucleotide-binding universal stress UspA family protein